MSKANGASNGAQAETPNNWFDMSKAFQPMNFSNPLSNMKLPGMDLEAWTAMQRKNAETMTQAGQQMFAGMQQLVQRQQEMARDQWSQATSMMGEVMNAPSPQEKVARQAECAKTALEKALANSRELLDMLTRQNQEAADALTSRMTEALDEVREACNRAK